MNFAGSFSMSFLQSLQQSRISRPATTKSTGSPLSPPYSSPLTGHLVSFRSLPCAATTALSNAATYFFGSLRISACSASAAGQTRRLLFEVVYGTRLVRLAAEAEKAEFLK